MKIEGHLLYLGTRNKMINARPIMHIMFKTYLILLIYSPIALECAINHGIWLRTDGNPDMAPGDGLAMKYIKTRPWE
jgi:hypothetical protein